ncbi:MAG: PilZ domain-containing protein [Thiomicrorhabdus sp.]|nr:PilZ domain-containing protein [Thiomicrorhabdus sp.]
MTEFTPQTDPRCSKRITTNRSATLQPSGTEEPVQAKLLNISMCGAGILCNHNLAIGDIVTLNFSLPNYDSENGLSISSKIACFSKVQKQYLIGVEFSQLDTHEELVIQSFTSYHERF